VRSSSRGALVALFACAALVVAAQAGAAVVKLGPELGPLVAEHHDACPGTCFYAEKSPTYTSPIDGEIIEWQVKGSEGTVEIVTLQGTEAKTFGDVGELTGVGKTSFKESLPIKKGESFGIQSVVPEAIFGYAGVSGHTMEYWAPKLAGTQTPTGTRSGSELLANVRILPPPVITSVTPNAGPFGAVNTATIKGENFQRVLNVIFGDEQTSWEVVSDTEIVAHGADTFSGPSSVGVVTEAGNTVVEGAYTFEAPPSTTPPVVTTPPSIAPIPPVEIEKLTFPEEHECHVPKLKGKTLKQAKRVLEAAHCKLGAVSRRKGPKAKRGKVVGEIPGAGAPARSGYPVKVTLGR
jgi:hypothetical protein